MTEIRRSRVAATVALPPQRIDAGSIRLGRTCDEDPQELARAVGASLEHLRLWMSWATPDAGEPESQRQRVARARARWDQGDCMYVVRSAADGEIVGGCGLHRRVGAGGIEIGYWTHVRHTGRGYATAAAAALTRAAFELPDIDRIEIHCDRANVRSQGIPRRLGYRLDRIVACEPVAPGEEGTRMIWVMDRTAQSPVPTSARS